MTEKTDVHEARRVNLNALIEKMGTLDAVAKAVGSSPVYLSQIRHGTPDSVHGTPRRMGSSLARRIETACGLAQGALDIPPTDKTFATVSVATKSDNRSLDGGFNEFVEKFDLEMLAALVDIGKRIRAQPDAEREICRKFLHNLCEPDGDKFAVLLMMMITEPKQKQ